MLFRSIEPENAREKPIKLLIFLGLKYINKYPIVVDIPAKKVIKNGIYKLFIIKYMIKINH